MTPRKRTSLKDIAASLGLSVNTVSRALSGKDSVSEETRDRVRAAAERMAYVPNTFARSLVRGSTRTIGLLVANPANPFYAQIITAVEERCRAFGYAVLLQVTDETVEMERRAADSLLWSAADGALVVPTQHDRSHLERLRDAEMPLVLVNRDIPELGVDFVGVDNERAAHDLTAQLVAAGATTILMIEDDLQITTIRSRIAGFRRAVEDAGRPEITGEVLHVPTRRQSISPLPCDADHVARAVVARPDRPDGIITGNDYYALAVYEALDGAGLEVPGDVLVAGFGDYPFSAYLKPPLTSVRAPAAEIGSRAVETLLARIDGSVEPSRSIALPADVEVRASTTRQPTGRRPHP